MAVEAVVFDIGETLVDETGMWERAAAVAGVTPFALMGVLGGLAARGEPHSRVWEILGVEPPGSTWTRDDWYPDALACIERLRAAGYGVYASGNVSAFTEDELRPHFDDVASAERWGVWKPAAEFFALVAELAGVPADKIAYVGDRVDNDVAPAIAAGMVGVHIRRGPWGYLQLPPEQAICIDSLDELPEALP